jgi:NADPH-dependent curcumin reductase CurA
MSIMINHRIVLASRPVGEAELSNFRLEATELPALQDGQVLVRHDYLSLDPYMRMRMNDAKSYAAPQAPGPDHAGRHRGRGAAVLP